MADFPTCDLDLDFDLGLDAVLDLDCDLVLVLDLVPDPDSDLKLGCGGDVYMCALRLCDADCYTVVRHARRPCPLASCSYRLLHPMACKPTTMW